MKQKCKSCDSVVINGVYCHEKGCPDAWRDSARECKECGCQFTPDESGQLFCSEACFYAFYGYPYADETN